MPFIARYRGGPRPNLRGPGRPGRKPAVRGHGEEGGGVRGPSSPRGWFAWSLYVREYQGRPHSPRLQYEGFSDRRTHDSRESAISIIQLADRASHAVCGNGVGLRLMTDFYANEVSWFAFTEPEQAIIRKTAREFSKRLRAAGFIKDVVREAREEDSSP